MSPGDIKYKDQNGDGVINEFDQVALGYNSSVPEIYYGFTLGAEWKGIGFSLAFQGVGHYTSWTTLTGLYRPLTNGNTISQYYYENRWTPEIRMPVIHVCLQKQFKITSRAVLFGWRMALS